MHRRFSRQIEPEYYSHLPIPILQHLGIGVDHGFVQIFEAFMQRTRFD